MQRSTASPRTFTLMVIGRDPAARWWGVGV